MIRPLLTNLVPQLQLERPWRLLRFAESSDVQVAIDTETKLLLQVGSGASEPVLCLTRHPQSLVITRRESRMENFAAARQILAAEGWPVAIRSSGGSCVPQGPGMLNLSLIFPRHKAWTLDQGYQLICAIFGQLLDSYGISAATGDVPGSFCDGRYNLQVEGKKLLGTAQRWAGGNRKQAAILIHGCLLVDLDLEAATAAVNRFYRLCNQPQRFKADACTSLNRCLTGKEGNLGLVSEVEDRLCRLLGELFSIR